MPHPHTGTAGPQGPDFPTHRTISADISARSLGRSSTVVQFEFPCLWNLIFPSASWPLGLLACEYLFITGAQVFWWVVRLALGGEFLFCRACYSTVCCEGCKHSLCVVPLLVTPTCKVSVNSPASRMRRLRLAGRSACGGRVRSQTRVGLASHSRPRHDALYSGFVFLVS